LEKEAEAAYVAVTEEAAPNFAVVDHDEHVRGPPQHIPYPPESSSHPGSHHRSHTQNSLPESLSPDPVSKVIHFRNVTQEITQGDLMALATPFGEVDKIVMMKTKNQCLLEFKELSSSIMMVNFYINTQPQVRGRRVYMRFSRHQGLTSGTTSSNRIILVTLQTDYQPTVPITADVVWQIFCPYGTIEKIVVLNKGSGLQALIQYQHHMGGSAAMQYLNGKTVYVGTDPILSITLYIQYSHLTDLTVRQNTTETRDYTTPLPWGPQFPMPPPFPPGPPFGGMMPSMPGLPPQ